MTRSAPSSTATCSIFRITSFISARSCMSVLQIVEYGGRDPVDRVAHRCGEPFAGRERPALDAVDEDARWELAERPSELDRVADAEGVRRRAEDAGRDRVATRVEAVHGPRGGSRRSCIDDESGRCT